MDARMHKGHPGASATTSGPRAKVAEEDRLRAAAWRLLADILSRAPDSERLSRLASLKGDDTAFGRAISALAAAAASMTPEEAEREYHDLFIGMTRGEVLPFASYYLTGFLNEKPLARLREDMARLGIAADPDEPDPEDHVASLCDMMAGLILGEFDAPACPSVAREFFEKHLDGWVDVFFRDLEQAPSARLYAPVGAAGLALVEIERQLMAMEQAAAEERTLADVGTPAKKRED